MSGECSSQIDRSSCLSYATFLICNRDYHSLQRPKRLVWLFADKVNDKNPGRWSPICDLTLADRLLLLSRQAIPLH